MMEVYLDNSATTKVDPEVTELMIKVMTEDFGNAASLHMKGVQAEKYTKTAREQIAATLKVDPKEILFTSGGTESNNLAILGAADARKRTGRHLITTVVEHASVKNVMKHLEDNGFDISFIPVDAYGCVSVDAIDEAIREDTIMVSVMYVNNEIGAVQPIKEIGEMIHKKHPNVLFHVDAIQGYGKFEIRPRQQHIDLLSVSGHKLHGPKGVGFLYIRDGVRINPILFGGGQQKNMRSGTENVPGEAGLGLAAEKIYRKLPEVREKLYALRKCLWEGLSEIEGTRLNGKPGEENAPHIVSCSFDGVRSEVLLHALEDRGIYVSSGSACSSSHPSEVNTLLAIGLERSQQEGTIRFSLCEDNTEEEIAYTLETLRELLPMLRRFVRR